MVVEYEEPSMLNLKIPPPVVGLTIGLIIYLLGQFAPSLNFEFAMFKILAYLLICIGILIEAWSVWLFFRARTTVNPLKPENSKALVATGMYKFTRNPMYLGLLLLLIGWTFWIGNPLGLPMLFVFVWYLTRFQIKPEERVLTELFGDQYIAYMRRVRRWV